MTFNSLTAIETTKEDPPPNAAVPLTLTFTRIVYRDEYSDLFLNGVKAQRLFSSGARYCDSVCYRV